LLVVIRCNHREGSSPGAQLKWGQVALLNFLSRVASSVRQPLAVQFSPKKFLKVLIYEQDDFGISLPFLLLASCSAHAQIANETPLMTKDLPDVPGKEV
jgi:hypothetical protein